MRFAETMSAIVAWLVRSRCEVSIGLSRSLDQAAVSKRRNIKLLLLRFVLRPSEPHLWFCRSISSEHDFHGAPLKVREISSLSRWMRTDQYSCERLGLPMLRLQKGHFNQKRTVEWMLVVFKRLLTQILAIMLSPELLLSSQFISFVNKHEKKKRRKNQKEKEKVFCYRNCINRWVVFKHGIANESIMLRKHRLEARQWHIYFDRRRKSALTR